VLTNYEKNTTSKDFPGEKIFIEMEANNEIKLQYMVEYIGFLSFCLHYALDWVVVHKI